MTYAYSKMKMKEMMYAYDKMKMKKTMHVVSLFQTVWKKGTIYKSIIVFGWLGCVVVKHHKMSRLRLVDFAITRFKWSQARVTMLSRN